jgi:hypothetical protein
VDQVGETRVVIDSVREEKHLVQVAPGKKEERSCLVVRLSHDEGKPVWVQLEDPPRQGEAHYFYAQANKYTAVFWDVKNVEKERIVLNLISLEDFKKPGRALEFRQSLPEPGPADTAPVKPRLLGARN